MREIKKKKKKLKEEVGGRQIEKFIIYYSCLMLVNSSRNFFSSCKNSYHHHHHLLWPLFSTFLSSSFYLSISCPSFLLPVNNRHEKAIDLYHIHLFPSISFQQEILRKRSNFKCDPVMINGKKLNVVIHPKQQRKNTLFDMRKKQSQYNSYKWKIFWSPVFYPRCF